MPQSSLHLLTEKHFVVGRLLGVGCFNAVYEARFDESALRESDLDPTDFGKRGAGYALKKPKRQQPALAALRRRSSAGARRRSSGGGGGGESVASTTRRGSSSSSMVSRRDSIASLDDDEDDETELMRLTAIADLERECDLMTDLDHPNVVRLHWILPGETEPTNTGTAEEGGPMLVLDRLRYTLAEKISQWRWAYREGRADADENDIMEGGQQGCGGKAMTKMRRRRSSLGEVMSSKRSARKRTATAFLSDRLGAALDVAEGMQYLHGRGIAHRDLKPDNIGFDANGRAKIFDFGLAKRLVEPTAGAEDDSSGGDGDDSDSSQSSSQKRPDCTPRRHSGCVGTLRYMAPEVARSDEYALDADVYSFGMLLYEICSLERPYGNIGRTDLSRKVHHHHRTGSDIDITAQKKNRRMSWVGGIGGRRSSLGGGGGDKFAARRETDGGSYRPKLPSAWPSDVRELMSRCWSDRPEERPEWDEIINVLRAERDSGNKERRACGADKERSSRRKGGQSSRSAFGRRRASCADTCSSHTVALSSIDSSGEGSGQQRGKFGFRFRSRRSSCGDEADDVLPTPPHGCDHVGGDGCSSSVSKDHKAVLYNRHQKEDPKKERLVPSFEASDFPAPLPEIRQGGVRNRLTGDAPCAA